MTQTDTDAIVDSYLRQLDIALRQVTPRRRRELIEEVSGHISRGREVLADRSAASVLDLLDKLGRPEEIAAAALAESDEQPPPSVLARSRGLEGLTVALLLFGGFAFLVGWLVGVALLWTSNAWRVRDKVLGTLLFPGGLVLPLLIVLGPGRNASGSNCVRNIPAGGSPVGLCTSTIPPSWGGILLLVAAAIVPIFVAVHLWRAAQTSRRDASPSPQIAS